MEFASAFPSNGIPDSALRRLNWHVRGEYGAGWSKSSTKREFSNKEKWKEHLKRKTKNGVKSGFDPQSDLI